VVVGVVLVELKCGMDVVVEVVSEVLFEVVCDVDGKDDIVYVVIILV